MTHLKKSLHITIKEVIASQLLILYIKKKKKMTKIKPRKQTFPAECTHKPMECGSPSMTGSVHGLKCICV